MQYVAGRWNVESFRRGPCPIRKTRIVNPLAEQSKNSGKKNRASFRPIYLAALLALAGLLVLASVLVFRGRDKATSQPGGPAGSEPSAPATAAAPGAATASAEPATAVLDELIRALNDATLPLNERKRAMMALAKNGSPKALAALKDALSRSSGDVRQTIIEAFGQCSSAECEALLLSFLKDPNAAVVGAALRGLAQQNQSAGGKAIAQMLDDPAVSTDLRCQAAVALGTIGESWVLDPLARAARTSDDEDLVNAALDAIGQLDINDAKGFIESYLQAPGVSSEMRATAVEALSQAQGDPTAFLAELAAKDPDPDVRAAAAWALSATDVTGNAGAAVLAMLANESDPDVRLRLYQALRNQASFDPAAALALVQNENNPSARVAGLDLLAKMLRDKPFPALQDFFDQTAIPELRQIALTGPSLNERQAAVLALTRAHTPGALAALGDLARQLNQSQPAPEAAPAPQ